MAENNDRMAEELSALKRYVAQLEEKLQRLEEGPVMVQSREYPRVPLEARISFVGEFDIVEAMGVNLSEGGICVEMEEDMYYEMRFDNHGVEISRRARLVWSRRLEKGGCRLGLEFVEPMPGPEF